MSELKRKKKIVVKKKRRKDSSGLNKQANCKWDDSFIDLAFECAAQGLVDTDIARKLGISGYTFYAYQKERPAFAAAIKAGKKNPNKKVEAAQFKRAMGYEVTETQITTQYAPGGIKVLSKTITSKIKHIPADVTAGIFWLKNRAPERWRDKVDHKVSGSLNLHFDKDDKNL